jgi:hypothetical protein
MPNRDAEEEIGPFPYWFAWLYRLKINATDGECQILAAGGRQSEGKALKESYARSGH